MSHLKVRHRQSNHYTGSKYQDDNAIHDVLAYIFNPAKTPSHYIGGIAVDPRNAEYEMTTLSALWGQAKGIRLRHMILAFDRTELGRSRKTALYYANALAFQVAQFYGSSYQIVYAVHEDTPKPHIHFVMNTTNYRTGRKYPGTHADLYQFIAHINTLLEPFASKVTFLKDDNWTPGTEGY